MTSKKLQQYEKEAWEAGNNNSYVMDILLEEAELFINNEVKGKLTDKNQEIIRDAYILGFFGDKLK